MRPCAARNYHFYQRRCTVYDKAVPVRAATRAVGTCGALACLLVCLRLTTLNSPRHRSCVNSANCNAATPPFHSSISLPFISLLHSTPPFHSCIGGYLPSIESAGCSLGAGAPSSPSCMPNAAIVCAAVGCFLTPPPGGAGSAAASGSAPPPTPPAAAAAAAVLVLSVSISAGVAEAAVVAV